MSKAVVNEMQAVLQQVQAELASVSERRELLNQEANHLDAAIHSILRRRHQISSSDREEATPRQLTLEEVAPLLWRGRATSDSISLYPNEENVEES